MKRAEDEAEAEHRARMLQAKCRRLSESVGGVLCVCKAILGQVNAPSVCV